MYTKGKIFYKYLTEDRIDVLENSSIRYTQPQFLNDPFECLVHFGKPSKSELLRQVEDRIDSIYKTCSDEDKKNLDKYREIYISAASEAFRKAIEQDFYVLDKVVQSKLNLGIGILSLSEINDSLLMWSHYANGHKGFVVGFEFPPAYFSYHSQYGNLRKVQYNKKIPEINAFSTFTKCLFIKSIDWRYECEWRIVRPLRNCKKIENNKDIYVHEFSKDYVKEIYLGANMDKQNKELIKSIWKNKYFHAKIYENFIDKNEDTYKISYKPQN